MNFTVETILLAIAFLLWLDMFIVLRILANKLRLTAAEERKRRELVELAHFFEPEATLSKKMVKRLFDNYRTLKQSIVLPSGERRKLLDVAKAERLAPALAKKIKDRNRHQRMEAAAGLALLGSDSARETLERALFDEKDFPTKLLIANALAEINDPRSLSALTGSLLGGHRWYRDKVNMLIASFGPRTPEFMRGYFWRKENEIVEMLVDLSRVHVGEDFKAYVTALLSDSEKETARLKALVHGQPDECCATCARRYGDPLNKRKPCKYAERATPNYRCRRFKLLATRQDPVGNHRRIITKAAESIEHSYVEVLDSPEFLDHGDKTIREIAIRSLGRGNNERKVEKLLRYLGDEETAFPARQGLSLILNAHPRFIPVVVDAFDRTSDKRLRQNIAEVLAGRIEYFIAKLAGKEKTNSSHLIREILRLGKVSEVLEFLKLNKDEELEDIMAGIIREEAAGNEMLRVDAGIYLPEKVLRKCGIERITPPASRREEKRDRKMVNALSVLLVVTLFLPVLLYIFRYGSEIFNVPLDAQLSRFVINSNYAFVWYSTGVNSVYLILLLLSSLKVNTSTRLWNLKTMPLLFKPRMLPSVSIIAPAYNEEKTILESASSLLNLKYPDYELVVVNDGSRDSTLSTIVTHYNLKRTDYYFQARLKTAQVHGVYTNPLYPRLIVVDKENGGKADSLNAGINIASKEYFCGIDADSLLEPDSLLKVAAVTLDYGVETPAMGGNVFPVNGCEVDHGMLTRIGVAKNNLAKLQTIEYLRAFMCGRLGWSQINSLLIISGAFGLFRKERVIDVGGYLTSKERYGRDTVGEDMELVVRIARMMREKKQKFRISYLYNANCWTEVPETVSVLKRQRDRWHRGLIDIMYFHRKLIFNFKYGTMGLMGLPYFLVFEVMGPIFETGGYALVALAAALGILSPKLAMMLFFSSILMGVLISISSLLIAERQIVYFHFRDTLKMFTVAVLENFGPRQIMSMWRVVGFFSAMKKPKGWGKMERRGFVSSDARQAGRQPEKEKKHTDGKKE